MKYAVAVSGGVDSSTAALLLRREGHEVTGLTALLQGCRESAPPGAENRRRCCGSLAEVRRARAACDALGVRHRVVDLTGEFEREVVEPTARAYARGLTPNPCVVCNARVRFPRLAEAARSLGAEALATGHYARLVGEGGGDAGVHLLRGLDEGHDQSYFLFAVEPGLLAFARFPLGEWAKEETRARAREHGLPTAEAPSSQDLCFVAGGPSSRGTVGALVEERVPEALRPGRIVLADGRELGRHAGLARYTVGQRKGIGVAWTEPLYVIELRPAADELVVGPARELERTRFEVEDARWLREQAAPFDALVQIRYRTPPVRGRVTLMRDGRGTVELARPVRAVAPGQCAVFYADDGPSPRDAASPPRHQGRRNGIHHEGTKAPGGLVSCCPSRHGGSRLGGERRPPRGRAAEPPGARPFGPGGRPGGSERGCELLGGGWIARGDRRS